MTVGSVSDPDTPPAPTPARRGHLLLLGLLLTLVSVAAALGGYLYFRNESNEVHGDARRQLELIARLRQGQLEDWRAERLGDGEVLLTRNAQSASTSDALSAQPAPDSVAATRGWMAGYIAAYHEYDRAYLLDADATVRIAVPADATPPAALVAEARAAMRSHTVRLVDFYRDEMDGNRPFLGLVSPVLSGSGGDAIGAVVLRIDPARFVWRTLATEIGSSNSGETELVRPDGMDRVVVLSPMRSDPQAALALRLPATDATRLSAIAVSGRTGLVGARDHRGIEVLAAIAPVRNSGWIVVTHIDNAELRSRLRSHLWLVSTGVVLLVVSSGAVLLLWRRGQRLKGYQKQAELSQAVRDGEERLRLALSSASQGLFDLNLLTGVAITSPEYATMLGYDPDGFTESLDSWRSRLHPDDLARATAALEAYLAGAVPSYQVEFRLRTAAGEWKWILSAAQIVARTGDGRPTRMLGTHTDITQQHAAEQALRDSEERLRLAMRSARQGFWDLDIATGRAVTSPEYAAMVGFDPATFEETSAAWNGRVHPDDLANALQVFDDYVAGRRGDYDLEFRHRHADGRWLWIHSVGRAVEWDADQRPARMIGIHTDVTARKSAELAAERQARLYRTLSLCNEAIVRSATAEELLPQVCSAAVEAGGFALSFIGMVDPATRGLDIVAKYGEPLAYLDGFTRSIAPEEAGTSPSMARALRERQALWVDNFHTSNESEHLRERAAVHGLVGGAVIPLIRGGDTAGVLAVYTTADAGFDSQSRALLTAIAADLGFALDGFARSGQQQKADLRLRQSESRYRAMFAESGVPMLLIDTSTGQISDANRAAAAFYGWDVSTLRRMHISDINTLDAERLAEILQQAGRTAQLRHTFQHRLASGEVRDVEAFSTTIVIDDQPRILAIVTDVTARTASARALFEKEYELTEAQRLAHVGSWTLGADGRNQWSDEMYRLFGLDVRQEVPGRDEFVSLIHPDDLPKVIAQMESNRQGHASAPIDHRIVRPDGMVRYVNARGELRTDAAGHTYLAGTVQDVTELRASEAALRIKDRAIESSLNAVAIADLDGRVTYVNAAFVELWAYDSLDTVVGRSVLSFWKHEADAAAVVRAIGEHGQWSGEMRASTQDGRTLDLLVSAVMVAGDSGAPVCMVGAFVDITARKRAEQTLVASLQEKEALLKEVHHRVKNNLQVISSLLRLELGRANDAGVKSVLGEMQGRIVSMALLHETLYRAENLAHVDLSSYLNRLVNQIFRSTAPTSGRIVLRVDVEPAAVDLEQAVPCGLLVNELVSNSLKHAFPDNRPGEVLVELTHVNGGPQLRLVVSDTGPGLPADISTRREQTLGLQLVSDLSRQLRGALTVSDGPGARFTLVFTPRPGAHAGDRPL